MTKTRGAQNKALVLKHKMQDWIGTRKQVQFWLNLSKQPEIEMFDMITWFKSKGLFRSSVMRGLRVVYAYIQNDIEGVIAELPNLKGMLGQGSNPPPPDNTELLKKIIANQERQLEQGITASIPPTGGLTMTGLQPMTKAATGQLLTTKAVSLPVFDDDDDIPEISIVKGRSAVENFLSGIIDVQH